jgi:hypothetical protein
MSSIAIVGISFLHFSIQLLCGPGVNLQHSGSPGLISQWSLRTSWQSSRRDESVLFGRGGQSLKDQGGASPGGWSVKIGDCRQEKRQ